VSAVVVDTHALVWYLTNPSKLSAAALAVLDCAAHAGDPIYMASITLVELRYLVEKGKVVQAALDRIEAHLRLPVRTIHLVPLDLIVCDAVHHIPRADVPDMPDRIIAATAHALGLPVVSRDRKIHSSAVPTIW
jgi:PIN domain nuclease of toxin-antitoxin system